MNTRTKISEISFRRPFTVNGQTGQLPAGTYRVETTEETAGNRFFGRYHPVSVVLHLPMRPGYSKSGQAVTVQPEDLDSAIKRDRKKYIPAPATVSSGYTP